MVEVEVKNQLDKDGNIVDKIAIITTQIPKTTRFSKTELQNQKENLEREIVEMNTKMEELDFILSKVT